jgi:hypothetical protein
MATSCNAEDLPHVGVSRTMLTKLNAEGRRWAIRAPTKRFVFVDEWQKYDYSPERHIVVANCSKNHTLQGSMGSVASSTHQVIRRGEENLCNELLFVITIIVSFLWR